MQARLLYIIGILMLLSSCKKEQATQLTVDFDFQIINNNYTTPVRILFNNKTTGTALFYKWTFTNASIAEYNDKNPGEVLFTNPGAIKVKLEAWNDEERKEKTIDIILDSITIAKFSAVPRINNIAPVEFDFKFEGQGATVYNWTFTNANVGSSSAKNPSGILYNTAGTYRVFLEAKNDRGVKDTISKWITVRPPLFCDYAITPSFDDEDYEAPLVATLDNHSISALNHSWSAPGGILSSTTDSLPTVRFNLPGTYTVSYTASNGKQTQTLTKTIVVKPNSFMRTFSNVQLGINTAHPSIGSFFSTKLRKSFVKDSVNATNGAFIDICYFGLSSSFNFNKLVSPDSVQNYTFTAIPNATKTSLVNSQESCNCGTALTSTAFDNIVNGNTFSSYSVVENAAGLGAFNNSIVPRVVLFKNSSGKTGAIKIKQYVVNGLSSYIICDIKVQKD
jgi:PKD repeat protein